VRIVADFDDSSSSLDTDTLALSPAIVTLEPDDRDTAPVLSSVAVDDDMSKPPLVSTSTPSDAVTVTFEDCTSTSVDDNTLTEPPDTDKLSPPLTSSAPPAVTETLSELTDSDSPDTASSAPDELTFALPSLSSIAAPVLPTRTPSVPVTSTVSATPTRPSPLSIVTDPPDTDRSFPNVADPVPDATTDALSAESVALPPTDAAASPRLRTVAEAPLTSNAPPA
jgi:hypothetical protein